MQLPVNWLAEASKPVWLARGSTKVDLRQAALDLRGGTVGGEKAWSVSEGGQSAVVITLRHTEPEGTPAHQIRTDLGGQENHTAHPLAENAPPLGQVLHHMRFAIDMSEADPVVKRAVLEQLKASPPTVLYDARPKAGGGMRIATLP